MPHKHSPLGQIPSPTIFHSHGILKLLVSRSILGFSDMEKQLSQRIMGVLKVSSKATSSGLSIVCSDI